jgi:hypothetical protein
VTLHPMNRMRPEFTLSTRGFPLDVGVEMFPEIRQSAMSLPKLDKGESSSISLLASSTGTTREPNTLRAIGIVLLFRAPTRLIASLEAQVLCVTGNQKTERSCPTSAGIAKTKNDPNVERKRLRARTKLTAPSSIIAREPSISVWMPTNPIKKMLAAKHAASPAKIRHN